MKKAVLLYSLFCVLNCGAQNWQWASAITYPSSSMIGSALATDRLGNIYTSTFFSEADGFLVKMNAAGAELWRKPFYGGVSINDVCCTGNRVFVTGQFIDTLQIEKSTVVSFGGMDIFYACFDENGNLLWLNHCGGIGNDLGNSICAAGNGKILSTGCYVRQGVFGTTTLQSPSGSLYIAVQDTLGNFISLRTASSADSLWYGSIGSRIRMDGNDILLLGTFSDIMIDTVALKGYGTNFLARFDSTLHVKWFDQIGDDYHPFYDLDSDAKGNIVVTGQDHGNHEGRTSTKRYNANGVFNWEETLGGMNYGEWWESKGVAFEGTDVFVIGNGGIYSTQETSLVLAKYDSLGNTLFVDTLVAGKSSAYQYAEAQAIERDINGDFIISGFLKGSLKFGSDSLVTTSRTHFIAKFKGATANTEVRPSLFNGLKVFPNPACDYLRFENANCAQGILTLKDSRGATLVKQKMDSASLRLDVSAFPAGMYFLELNLQDETYREKLILAK